jgi:hypothetical protein
VPDTIRAWFQIKRKGYGDSMGQSNENEIFMDYRKTLEDARELESLGSSLLRSADSENDVLENLASLWKGKAGREYVIKGRRHVLLLKKKGQKLISESQALKESAERNYRTEQALLSILQR